MKRKLLIVSIFGLIVLAWTLACLGVSGKTSAARADTAPPPKPFPQPAFIVGVWYQPISSFPTWRDRGINTLVGIETEGTHTAAQVIAAAHAMNFWVIGKDPGADVVLNGLDEPDGAGNVTPAAYVANYGTLKGQQPGKLVFGNFDGEKTRWRPVTDYAGPGGYFAGADVIGVDWYLTNKGLQDEGGWDIYTSRVDFAVQHAGGKPVLVAIECSDQNLRVQSYLHVPENQPQGERWAAAMRCPTPAEQSREVQIAVQHGAKGIFYFPDRIGNGWEGFDGTPEANAIQMRSDNLKLTTAATPPVPPIAPVPVPAKGPLDGTTATIGGNQYLLTSK